MTRRPPRLDRRLLLLAVIAVRASLTTLAQSPANVGYGVCVDCHDHKDEDEWARKLDGDGKKQHFNAKNQLRDSRSVDWAKLTGFDKVDDVKGTCAACHITVVNNSPKAGITCEICHGPGSEYLEVHKEKDVGYAKALRVGMKDLRDKPENWVKDCLNCHILGNNKTDAALAQAGHPDGADFNVALKYERVGLHWKTPKKKYTENRINALAAPLRSGLLARVKSVKPVAPTPVEAKPAKAEAKPETPPEPPPAAATADREPTKNESTARNSPEPPARTAPPATKRDRAPLPPMPPPAANPTPPAPVIVAPLPLPRTPAGVVAAVQGKLATILDGLLSKGVTTPVPVMPPGNAYRGADADLLRLQQEVIALALEALGTKPVAPPKK